MGIRINCKAIRERLIEISSCNDIVSLFVFLLDIFLELLSLRKLPLAVIIGFKVKIDNHKLLIASLDGNPCHKKAALKVRYSDRPRKRAWKRNAFCRGQIKASARREQSAVDPAYHRQRVWNKSA